MKSLLNTFFTLCLLAWNQKVMAYMVGVGRGDCTGPPVGVNFVSSIFLHIAGFFLLFYANIPIHVCMYELVNRTDGLRGFLRLAAAGNNNKSFWEVITSKLIAGA